jgi:hypothetical protein
VSPCATRSGGAEVPPEHNDSELTQARRREQGIDRSRCERRRKTPRSIWYELLDDSDLLAILDVHPYLFESGTIGGGGLHVVPTGHRRQFLLTYEGGGYVLRRNGAV